MYALELGPDETAVQPTCHAATVVVVEFIASRDVEFRFTALGMCEESEMKRKTRSILRWDVAFFRFEIAEIDETW